LTTSPNHSRYRVPCLYAVSSAAPGPIGRQRLAIALTSGSPATVKRMLLPIWG
jgi:hypothetical protein